MTRRSRRFGPAEEEEENTKTSMSESKQPRQRLREAPPRRRRVTAATISHKERQQQKLRGCARARAASYLSDSLSVIFSFFIFRTRLASTWRFFIVWLPLVPQRLAVFFYPPVQRGGPAENPADSPPTAAASGGDKMLQPVMVMVMRRRMSRNKYRGVALLRMRGGSCAYKCESREGSSALDTKHLRDTVIVSLCIT